MGMIWMPVLFLSGKTTETVKHLIPQTPFSLTFAAL
jgi:hypothetical protein